MRQIIINAIGTEKRMALIDGSNVIECVLFRPENKPVNGQIYKGRVQKVLPGMQAAFIDIGSGKNGFLHRDDLREWAELKIQKEQISIAQLIKEGQELLVQVIKEESGDKGVRLTGIVSFSGEKLVYFPYSSYIGVSKKMTEDDREFWRTWGEDQRIGSEGMVLRTSCDRSHVRDVLDELNKFRNEYQRLVSFANGVKTPSLLYKEAFYERLVKRWASSNSVEIVTDDRSIYEELNHNKAFNVTFYRKKEGLFSFYGIETELQKAVLPDVWLKNGASIRIDHTEAMTVVDVNTTKFTGKTTRSDTIIKTNILAAYEIARQLRLRGIGGMIVIDFITMKTKQDEQKVLAALKEAMKSDNVTSIIHGFTNMGLFELTRKKERVPLSAVLLDQACSRPSSETIYFHLERTLLEMNHMDEEAVWVETGPGVMTFIRSIHSEWWDSLLKRLTFEVLTTENNRESSYRIRQTGTKNELKDRILKELH